MSVAVTFCLSICSIGSTNEVAPTNYLGPRSRSSCIESELQIETSVFDYLCCSDIRNFKTVAKHSGGYRTVN